ncbi:S8 family serine peptidase [Rubrobacter marinus]|uniref:S8 family serine peptidase n=1 Tax=Rubrobacter marinus TaxID=2653852 RepID=A0A6G8Q217_9ACTN|nr:S8 family serine peptidase [Rubrobacter marinus]QIN80460.1 S8 family serine peptidase [Rubrobacter marinus]
MRSQAIRRASATPITALLLLVLFGVLALQPDPARAQESDGGEFVDGEIVVKLTPGTDVAAVNRDYGTQTKDTFLGSARIYLLGVADGEGTEAKAERMEEDGLRFSYAEPNFVTDVPEGKPSFRARADSAPAPSSDRAPYGEQYAVGALNLPCANGISRGAGAVVAILDTGVQQGHPDLRDSLVPGYDFVDDEPNPEEEPEGTMTGHGTHVAGIVHLAAPDAKIMPLRVLDAEGRGNVFVIAEAVQRAVDPDGNPATDDGADVINLSLGSSTQSELLADVTDDLSDDDDVDALRGVPAEGVVAVASAGNESAESLVYPAAEAGVLAVASVGEDETKSDFSNFGSSWIDVAAPGDDVYSAFPTDRYASWDGTSMAAPFVAGQAALIRSREGSSTPAAVEALIRETARPLDAKNPAYAGKLGAGHADVGASMQKQSGGSACASPLNPRPEHDPPSAPLRTRPPRSPPCARPRARAPSTGRPS